MAKSSPRLTKMEELAKVAGVSVSTVSRALAGNPLINAKTRARIADLAAKHNYQINENARNFRLQKTNVIAVVLMLDVKSEQHTSDMFFLEMLGAIADALSVQNYDLLLANSPMTNVLDIHNSRIFRQSDGIVFIGQGNQHNQLNEQITRVLEINGKHPLITALAGIAGADGAGSKVSDAAWLLLDQARILEGEPLPDPTAFVRRMADLMAKGVAV